MSFFIFSGGPGCGKSSVILHLEKEHGFAVVHEAAESIIRIEKAKGNPRPWESPGFQRRICELQGVRMARVDSLSKSEPVLLDRYFVDSIAYSREMGRTGEMPDAGMDNSIPVFFFDLLPSHESNDIRREDAAQAARMHSVIASEYENMGFKIIRVPQGTLEERSAFVIDKMAELRKHL